MNPNKTRAEHLLDYLDSWEESTSSEWIGGTDDEVLLESEDSPDEV